MRPNKPLFLKLVGHPRDIPAKSRDIPPESLVSLGFEGHTELFGPHPFTWKPPTPPENIRTKKFGFGFLFFLEDGRSFFYILARVRKISPKFLCPKLFGAAWGQGRPWGSGHGCPHPNACSSKVLLEGVSVYPEYRRPKPMHQYCAKGSPATTLKALWCICIFLLFLLKTSVLGYTQPLFSLLRHLSFQS